MKVIINACFGGFHLDPEVAEHFGITTDEESVRTRTNPALIAFVEQGNNTSGWYTCKATVLDIPDEATDWEIEEYDGLESITYVVDGMLHHAYPIRQD